MGLTQQKKAVETLRELINLLLLRGNIGKPGAGASPIRGHSNVQGDRTMGIWEQMPDTVPGCARDASSASTRRASTARMRSRRSRAMQRGEISVFIAMGGNFVSAISDTAAAEAAMRGTDLSVQVSTKLNRSHVVTGQRGAHPADAGPHRGGHPGDGRAVRLRRGQRVRRARVARPRPAGRPGHPLRDRDRLPARSRDASATGSASTGPVSRATTTSSATTSAMSCPVSRTSTRMCVARAASSCPTARATPARSTRRPARR